MPGTAKYGTAKYSNMTRSGAPEPAWMALSSALNSSWDEPALTTSTVMSGWAAWKPGTAFSTVPSQLQTVIFVRSPPPPPSPALEPPPEHAVSASIGASAAERSLSLWESLMALSSRSWAFRNYFATYSVWRGH
ncbi:hypothetical protein B0I32_113282 [Nonomuraea fuscirosea]|uniref:Uncharacterized protein n=1 Tax=Nonomuraea fuscirosea TaxID=1291556 RepID=A0A2T0MUH7_9ACTN|nr:hypothetical protein B0I32_113282 [Nonomuraea fuscirosea]